MPPRPLMLLSLLDAAVQVIYNGLLVHRGHTTAANPRLTLACNWNSVGANDMPRCAAANQQASKLEQQAVVELDLALLVGPSQDALAWPERRGRSQTRRLSAPRCDLESRDSPLLTLPPLSTWQHLPLTTVRLLCVAVGAVGSAACWTRG